MSISSLIREEVRELSLEGRDINIRKIARKYNCSPSLVVKNVYKVEREENYKHITKFGVKGKVNLLIIDFQEKKEEELKQCSSPECLPSLTQKPNLECLPALTPNSPFESSPHLTQNSPIKFLPSLTQKPNLEYLPTPESLPPVTQNSPFECLPHLTPNPNFESSPPLTQNSHSESSPLLKQGSPSFFPAPASECLPLLTQDSPSECSPLLKQGSPSFSHSPASAPECLPALTQNSHSESSPPLTKNSHSESSPLLMANPNLESSPHLTQNSNLQASLFNVHHNFKEKEKVSYNLLKEKETEKFINKFLSISQIDSLTSLNKYEKEILKTYIKYGGKLKESEIKFGKEILFYATPKQFEAILLKVIREKKGETPRISYLCEVTKRFNLKSRKKKVTPKLFEKAKAFNKFKTYENSIDKGLNSENSIDKELTSTFSYLGLTGEEALKAFFGDSFKKENFVGVLNG